jgi:CBS domain-containing protein
VIIFYVGEESMSQPEKKIDLTPDEMNRKLFTYITQILGLRAYDVMHDATFQDGDTTVEEAAKKMAEGDVSELIVVDKDKKVVGIVTDKDIVRRVVSKGLNPKEVKLRDIMTKEVVVVLGEADLGTVVQLMNKHKIRRMPVVNKIGKLLGVIDARDLAGALGAQRDVLKRIVQGLETQLVQIAKEVEEAKKKAEEEEKEKNKKIYG